MSASPSGSSKPGAPRTGSAMSTRQMANAAVRGRRLTFNTGATQVQGYLVGMDDYHWLVAEPVTARTVETHLIHKGVPHVKISHMASLTDESTEVQEQVRQIGASFFAYCDNLLGRSVPQECS